MLKTPSDTSQPTSFSYRSSNLQLSETGGDPDDESWDRTFIAAAYVGAMEACLIWLIVTILPFGVFTAILLAPVGIFGAVIGLMSNVILSKSRWAFHLFVSATCGLLFLWLVDGIRQAD